MSYLLLPLTVRVSEALLEIAPELPGTSAQASNPPWNAAKTTLISLFSGIPISGGFLSHILLRCASAENECNLSNQCVWQGVAPEATPIFTEFQAPREGSDWGPWKGGSKGSGVVARKRLLNNV